MNGNTSQRAYPPNSAGASGPSEKMKALCARIHFAGERLAADLFDGLAAEIAGQLDRAIGNCNNTTQLRRFYDEVVDWEQRLIDEESFRNQEAFFRMLKAKVAYAYGRNRDEAKKKAGLVDDDFRHWFAHCVDRTTSPQELQRFRLHFEAVLGFLKALRA